MNQKEDMRPPKAVRYAGILGILEGVAGLIYAAAQIIHQAVSGPVSDIVVEKEGSKTLVEGFMGYGTAAFLIIIFGAVAVAGYFMYKGRAWGRGPVTMLQMFCFVFAYYLWGAGQYIALVVVLIIGFIGLGLVFNRQAVEWAASKYRR